MLIFQGVSCYYFSFSASSIQRVCPQREGQWKTTSCKTKQVIVYRIKCRLLFIKSPKGLKSHIAGNKTITKLFFWLMMSLDTKRNFKFRLKLLNQPLKEMAGCTQKERSKYILVHTKRLGTQWVTWLSQWGGTNTSQTSQIGSFPAPPPVPTNMTQPGPLSLILFYWLDPWTLESPRSPEVF